MLDKINVCFYIEIIFTRIYRISVRIIMTADFHAYKSFRKIVKKTMEYKLIKAINYYLMI